jgi:hypothetical protein
MDLHEKKKLAQLKIPQSSEIFYFDHDVYDEKILGPFISKENFDYILTECEKVVCMSHIKKVNFEKQTIKKWIYIFGIISIIIFIIFLIILLYIPRHNNTKTLYYVGFSCGIFGYFILFIIIFYNIFKKKVIGKHIEDFVYEELTNYFKSVKNDVEEISFKYDKKKKMIILSFPEYKERKNKKKIKFGTRESEFLLESQNFYFPSRESANLIVHSFDNFSPRDNLISLLKNDNKMKKKK